MRFSLSMAVIGSLIISSASSRAVESPATPPAQPAPVAPPAQVTTETKTIMTERGKSLFTDDFAGPAIAPEWKVAKGTWAITDGTLKGIEKPEDMHAAVVRRDLKFHNIVASVSFRFDGGKNTSFSMNDSKGHVARVGVTPAGFTVAKDKANKTTTEKGAQLDKIVTPIKPGEWHTLVLEVCGKDIVATIDDTKTALGTHDGIDVDKTNFGFPVGGAGVSFRNLKVWEATPKADWERTKAKLMASREKQASGK